MTSGGMERAHVHCGASLSKIEGNGASDARVSAGDDVRAIAAVDLQGVEKEFWIPVPRYRTAGRPSSA